MKKTTLAAIAAIVMASTAICGIVSPTKSANPPANALALANIEALSTNEIPDPGEDKSGEYFIVDNSSTTVEEEDLGDAICYTTIYHINISCPFGGNKDCTPIQADEIVDRRYKDKNDKS